MRRCRRPGNRQCNDQKNEGCDRYQTAAAIAGLAELPIAAESFIAAERMSAEAGSGAILIAALVDDVGGIHAPRYRSGHDTGNYASGLQPRFDPPLADARFTGYEPLSARSSYRRQLDAGMPALAPTPPEQAATTVTPIR
ncbi:MAG: hypothetical protein J0H09_15135 [Burkholderiales bacterium]|nr:hypothetical protein [Burkholderiales bacterium]